MIEKLIVGAKLPFDEDYAEDMDTIHFLNISYEAKGIDYTLGDAMDGPIIHKNECEKTAAYKERCKRTPTRSYVSSIINKYNSCVFRNEPTRQIDNATYELIYNDADGAATSLNDLMQKSLLCAQKEGSAFLLADSTATDTDILTLAQKTSSGARPYIRRLSREHVVAYEEIENTIMEAIILLTDENGKTFARYMNDQDFVDITINDRFVIEDIGEAYSHNYSRIPLVEVEPLEDAQAEPIAYSQRTIVNILSQLSQERVKSVWTKHILSGVRLPQDGDNAKPVVSWSESEMVVLEDAGAKLDTLGADIGCSDSLRKDIEQEEQQLYYSAGFGKANSTDPTNVSGYSLSIMREDFFLMCSALSKCIETAENKIMELIAEKEGFDYTPAVYSNRFIADDTGAALASLRDLLALPLPQTFKNAAIRNYISQYYNVSDEEKNRIETELTSNIAEA